jgi:hypothetical protein
VPINEVSSFYTPINSSFAASASRTVNRSTRPGNAFDIVSAEIVESKKFSAQIHPLMANSLPKIYTRGIKGSFLGLVSEDQYSCSSYNPQIIFCGDHGGYEIAIPAEYSLPDQNFKRNTYLKVYSSGGSVSVSPRGTPYFMKAGTCALNCDETVILSVDFKFSNMMPNTIRL